MGAPLYVDISAFQPVNIDWKAYRTWAAQWDGIARVAIRSSYGVGYTDVHFATYRAGALAAGVDVIIYYHYAYPEYNSATAEADWQHKVVGAIRPQDVLMLDYEEGASQANAAWAYTWLSVQEINYSGKLPTIYASDYYVRQRLQDGRLARYPLTLANWQFDPNERPACPPPWSHYTYLQYTDRAVNIPGIAGSVDANIYLGGDHMSGIPLGWHDDGTTLTAPNGVQVVLGFRAYVLAHNWDSSNVPVGPQYYTQRLEDSNPDLGDGDQLVFLYGDMLGYPHNPTGTVAQLKNTVVHEWAGKELNALRDQVTRLYPLAKQVPDLEAQITLLKQSTATGISADKVANFQQVRSLEARALVQGAQALETALIQTIV